GTVLPCCLDRNGDLSLGNLFEAPLETILSSPRAARIYDGFTKHICSEDLCRRCMRAGYYREQNQA
ncbi:MAG: SPASM domain-containing protein, partial [Eubacteriales bacterium]